MADNSPSYYARSPESISGPKYNLWRDAPLPHEGRSHTLDPFNGRDDVWPEATKPQAPTEMPVADSLPCPPSWNRTTIDVFFETPAHPVVTVTKVSADGTLLRDWLVSRRRSNPFPRLRLLLYSREDSSQPLLTWKGPGLTSEVIMEALRLPRNFSAACKHHEFLAHVENKSIDQSRGFGMVLRMMSFDLDGCCLGLSYDPDICTTHALLIGLRKQSQLQLRNLIDQSASLAWHPLFLPVLLLRLRNDRASSGVVHATQLSFDFDRAMRFGDPSSESVGWEDGHRSMPAASADFEEAIYTLNRLNTDIGFAELMLRPLTGYGPTFIKLFDYVQSITAKAVSRRPLGDDMTNILQRTCLRLRADAEFLQSSNEGLLFRVQHIQKKLQIQLSVIQNFIAHRDTKINKRDSSAMKTIAVLTMLFLPATTIASFFAMPLFNWSADSAQSIVTDRFWIYWAVTVPFTGVILGVWAVWTCINTMMEEKKSGKKVLARQSTATVDLKVQ